MSCGCASVPLGPSLATSCYGGTFVVFMAILDSLIRKECDISEPCKRIIPKTEPEPEYDFIVIGGGSGGATAAGRLAQANPSWKILLIEAGPDEPAGAQVPSMIKQYLSNPIIDWDYKTEPEKYACQGYTKKQCTWPRGKVLGGTSVIHGMMYMKGMPRDYDLWESMGNTGWGYKDVFPILNNIEGNEEIGTLVDAKYHGSEGPLTTKRFNYQPPMVYDILNAAKEIGYPVSNDLNGAQKTGFGIAQNNVRNGTRLSSSKAYVWPQRTNPNFHVMINSTVTKILTTPNGNQTKATGVTFVYKKKIFNVTCTKEVILAAGALNSPQILLLSGIGPKNELNKLNITSVNDLPGVGKNLQNHVAFFIRFKMNKVRNTNDLDWPSVKKYLRNRTGPLSCTGTFQITGKISSKYADPDGQYPDLQFFFNSYLAQCTKTGLVGAPADPKHPKAARILEISPVCLHPKSKGEVKLASTDPLSPPSMTANYLQEPEDAAIIVDGIRIIERLMNTSVLMKKYGMELVKEEYGDCANTYNHDTDEFWDCAIRYLTGPENHQATSCKMGPKNDTMAVVNEKLEVYGVSGLRIMDASVMPYIVSGNPHATIVLIGHRGADFIFEKWLENKKN